MKIYWVYILECADGKYYTGITNDIERRYREHQLGEDPTCWTFRRRPVKLVFHTTTSNVEFAIELEKRIKKWSRSKKQALIEERYDELPVLAEAGWQKPQPNHSNSVT